VTHPDAPAVRIAIDEIVLHGVDVADPRAFGADLLAELTALARGYAADRARGTAPAHPGGRAALLHGAPVSAPSPTLPADVARSVWESMIPPAGSGGAADRGPASGGRP
jgi:hypothetical protein